MDTAMQHGHKHALWTWPCSMDLEVLHVHIYATCPCLLHVHVHAVCPRYCLSMSILMSMCSCPCSAWTRKGSTGMVMQQGDRHMQYGYGYAAGMDMPHVQVQLNTVCPRPCCMPSACCISQCMLHGPLHAACPGPCLCCMSMQHKTRACSIDM
jgi:hypothetical protein